MKLDQYLTELGVSHVFFGLGHRNEPFVKRLNSFQLHFGFEERSLAFKALGLCRASKGPVAICVTSGTALAECFPAIIEAYHDQLQLIIISADRSKQLQHTDSPQLIKQENIFGKYCRHYTSDLNMKDVNFPLHINLCVDFEQIDSTDILCSKLNTRLKTPRLLKQALSK